jgi:hypothetical protein
MRGLAILLGLVLVGCGTTASIDRTYTVADTVITVGLPSYSSFLPVLVETDTLIEAWSGTPQGNIPEAKTRVRYWPKKKVVEVEHPSDSVSVIVPRVKEERTEVKTEGKGFLEEAEGFLTKLVLFVCVVGAVALLVNFWRK